MRLHVVVVFFLLFLLGMFAFGMLLALSSREARVKRKMADVRTHATMFMNRLGTLGGMSGGISDQMSHELKQAAVIYDGRILITDQSLCVLADTNSMDIGKTLISEEVILALKGSAGSFRNDEYQYIEHTLPIIENETQNVIGVFFVRASTADLFATEKQLTQMMWMLLSFFGFLFFLFVLLFSGFLTKPLKKTKKAIEEITKGSMEDVGSVSRFYEVCEIFDAFNSMLGRFRQLENSRQEFVSNVSHELKTPMTSMKVLADSLLSQEGVPEELYREFLTDINAEIERENKIITDLLSLVKLDRTDGEMHIAQTNINALLDVILKRLSPIAKQNGVELIYESFRNVIATVDEVKLSLAVSNLLENAIKYNHEGGFVKLSLNADHKFFTISVADSGIGIAQEDQKLIFDRFYRVDKTRARETGGSGLGLSIVKNVILMHNGTIKLLSREGEGAIFTVKIPLSFIKEQKPTE